MEEEKKRLLKILKNLSYEEGDFTLVSGKKSTFYIDCKETTLNPEGMYLVGHLMYNAVRQIPGAQAVGGVSIGGDPLVCATVMVSYAASDPIAGFLIRKEPKGHGTGAWLEGRKNFHPGARVVIVEDVVTTGGSSIKAVRRAEEEGLKVLGIVTLVDREEGGRENIEKEGYWLRSIFTKSEILA